MRIGRGFFVPRFRHISADRPRNLAEMPLARRQRPNPRNPALPTLPNPQYLDQRRGLNPTAARSPSPARFAPARGFLRPGRRHQRFKAHARGPRDAINDRRAMRLIFSVGQKRLAKRRAIGQNVAC